MYHDKEAQPTSVVIIIIDHKFGSRRAGGSNLITVRGLKKRAKGVISETRDIFGTDLIDYGE